MKSIHLQMILSPKQNREPHFLEQNRELRFFQTSRFFMNLAIEATFHEIYDAEREVFYSRAGFEGKARFVSANFYNMKILENILL